MLFDEPSEGIQPSIINDIARHVDRLNRDEGISVLLVEQNLDLIVSIAHRGYVLEKGKVVAELKKQDIRDESIVRKYLAL
ncbi:MAG: hypothetical protein AB8B64_27320 [Granulosicoccus sp.]